MRISLLSLTLASWVLASGALPAAAGDAIVTTSVTPTGWSREGIAVLAGKASGAGAVTILDGKQQVARGMAAADGTFTIAITGLDVGSHVFVACASGTCTDPYLFQVLFDPER